MVLRWALLTCILSFAISSADITKIAMGSCHGQFFISNPQIFASIASWHPGLFIWLGDAVYADALSYPYFPSESDLVSWNNLYKDLKSQPEYLLLLNSSKITGIWDDHDYGINDGDHTFNLKTYSQEMFMDFLGEEVQHEGIYRVYQLPDPRIKIILLDCRYFRVRGQDMLGETQWAWLEQELKSEQRLTFIASGLQVNVEDRFSITEQWDDPSRLRLMNLIKEKPGVILLTGDIHFGEVLVNQCWKFPLIEFTSSGLSHTEYTLYGSLAYWYLFMCNAMTYHSQPRVLKKHFGTIEIDWDREIIEFTLKDTFGKDLIRQSAYISDLNREANPNYLCAQDPFERHLNHLLSCFVVFHVPIIIVSASIIITLRKYTHIT